MKLLTQRVLSGAMGGALLTCGLFSIVRFKTESILLGIFEILTGIYMVYKAINYGGYKK